MIPMQSAGKGSTTCSRSKNALDEAVGNQSKQFLFVKDIALLFPRICCVTCPASEYENGKWHHFTTTGHCLKIRLTRSNPCNTRVWYFRNLLGQAEGRSSEGNSRRTHPATPNPVQRGSHVPNAPKSSHSHCTRAIPSHTAPS